MIQIIKIVIFYFLLGCFLTIANAPIWLSAFLAVKIGVELYCAILSIWYIVLGITAQSFGDWLVRITGI